MDSIIICNTQKEIIVTIILSILVYGGVMMMGSQRMDRTKTLEAVILQVSKIYA